MNGIVSGKVRLDVQPIELSSIVEAALDSTRPSADAKAIALRKTIDPHVTVYGDRNRLLQVVWNLLTNAVKFTPKGGKIDVIVERVNSHVEVTVHDSGLGINAEFLPHMFERFRQADSSTTRKYGGLGLGLSIVKQLVELHGGTVKAESAGEGKGATFIVCLPLRAVRDSAVSSREHPTTGRLAVVRLPAISLLGLKVLVVDDEPDARELVQSVLADAGAEAFTASSADEAFALVQSRRPDVIVSDIGMPERDGYQFMRDVRGLGAAAGGKTPAIALTAFARSEDRTRAMLAGYQVHVAKPIDPQELVATIKSQTSH
jgi:CheY-like chemotaxis protein/anti-sigma regulatory factor (Ser/Thr protein kinase)